MADEIKILSIDRETSPAFFPPELWQIKRPPSSLFIQGKPSAWELFKKLPERGLAIVGSREGQMRSRKMIHDVLAPLAGFDWIIVSGLARGIDAWAHEAALRFGFPTVAILGCGLDLTYPVENQGLRKRILDSGGLVMTELELGHEPLPWTFIHRNRLIAAWSRATWVVQAGFRSGALNTASWAVQHERSLFATPHYPGDPSMVGNQRLLSDGTAHAVWNSQSFGQVWLEIESFLCARSAQKPVLSRELSPKPLRRRASATRNAKATCRGRRISNDRSARLDFKSGLEQRAIFCCTRSKRSIGFLK
jgi:DNA processing protein